VVHPIVQAAVRGTLSLVILAAVLFGAFLAWRIPREREEDRLFKAHVQRDDGPHVTWLDDRTVRVSSFRFDASREEYERQEVTSRCDDAGPLVAALDPNAWIECNGSTPEPVAAATARVVAAVSDVHGHFNHLAALLQRSGVVNARLDWSFGANHLVVAGDIVDKGPQITRSLWLVKKLERQAAEAGGRVHYLLGNHEYLALAGTSRINDRKYIELTGSLGIRYADLFSNATELGRWIREHGVVVRVNDTLFVHAGIARSVVDAGVSLEGLNRIARETLDRANPASSTVDRRAALVWGRDGITSYRGYFDRSFPIGFWRAFQGDLREGPGADEAVARALESYGARRMVVGHTEGRQITSFVDGRLLAICQGMPFTDFVGDESRLELLLIDGSRAWRVGLDGNRQAM